MNYRLLSIITCLSTLLGGGVIGAEESPAAARQKSVTVYPIVFTPAESVAVSIPERAAEVVGNLLERAGMEQIEIGQSAFSPPATDDSSNLAAAFGQFIEEQSLNTEYAVLGQFVRSKETGIEEIRTIVVDKAGKVVFADSAGQEAFSRSKIKPKDPMSAAVFLVNRLGNVWKLADPLRKNAPEGKMAEALRKRSGLPAETELAAMKERVKLLQDNTATSKVSVYRADLWPGFEESNAGDLVALLNEQSIVQAEASTTMPKLTVEGDPNQQKILWDTARAFQEFLRKTPPATDYALLVDYGLYETADGQRTASHVHLILCDRAADWVLVDFQNSHHSDFQSIAPKSSADCLRLAAKRLKNRLAE